MVSEIASTVGRWKVHPESTPISSAAAFLGQQNAGVGRIYRLEVNNLLPHAFPPDCSSHLFLVSAPHPPPDGN